MTDFSERAKEWDTNPMHLDRSKAIASALLAAVPETTSLRLLDFGAGSGLLGELLAPHFKEVVLMDSAAGMVEVMRQKATDRAWTNLVPVCHDLLEEDFQDEPFDGIVTQMVLHHIEDVSALLSRFNHLLRAGGFLAIADLYSEDGSFHGEGFDGHLGFDQEWLEHALRVAGFDPVSMNPCYVIRRERAGQEQAYPVFLSVSRKK